MSGAALERQVRRATGAFRDRTGRQPDGVWAAPGRVNLIGEHTDYNDGFVLPIAIDRHVVVAMGSRTERTIRLWSLQQADVVEIGLDDVGPGVVRGWGAYPAGVAWALRRDGIDVPGHDLVVDGSVPVASGLSSSAALECAVAAGLVELAGADIDRSALALVAQRAEVESVGMPCGVMDQMASVLCRAGHALHLDARSLWVGHVPFEPTREGLALVIVDTRATRRLVQGMYAERRAECDAAAESIGVSTLRDASLERLEDARARLGARLYRRARHVVTENDRVRAFVEDLHSGAWLSLGPLLTSSHESLRDDFEVSSPELDEAADAALAVGALGARMTGAGFGGCAIALAPMPLVDKIVAEVEAAFARRSFRAPEAFTVVAVDGARRVDR